MRRTCLYSILPLVILLSFISCKKSTESATKDETLLAKVADEVITVQQLTELFPQYSEGLITDDAAYKAKRALLDDLIAEKLLIMEARQRGLGTDYDIATDMEMIEETALVQALYDSLIIDQVISEEELRADFDSRYKEENQIQFKIRHILVTRINEAREILKRIQNGEDFTALARQYSQDKSKIRGGELDWMTMDSAPVREIAVEAVKLDAGTYGSIIKSRFGYHVYQLIDKRPYQMPPYENVREDIRRRLSFIHADTISALAQTHIDSLRLVYHVQMVPDVFDVLVLRVRETRPAPSFSEATIESASNTPQFQTGEAEKILFLFDGGKFTLGDYAKRVKYYHPVKQPKGDDIDYLKEVSNNMVNAMILGTEARDLKLDKLPKVTSYLDMRKSGFDKALDKTAVKQLMQIEVKNKIALEPGESKTYFTQNPQKYVNSDGSVPQFEEVEEKVLEDLIAQKEEEIKKQYIEHLKTIYKVVVYEDNFEKAFRGVK